MVQMEPVGYAASILCVGTLVIGIQFVGSAAESVSHSDPSGVVCRGVDIRTHRARPTVLTFGAGRL